MIYVFFAVLAVFSWWLALKGAAVQDRSPSMVEWDRFREAGERMSE